MGWGEGKRESKNGGPLLFIESNYLISFLFRSLSVLSPPSLDGVLGLKGGGGEGGVESHHHGKEKQSTTV